MLLEKIKKYNLVPIVVILSQTIYNNFMKKQSVLNLIKYHVERDEKAFREESVLIAKYFDSIGDYQLAEYIMGLICEANLLVPQAYDFQSEFLKQIDLRRLESLHLPLEISKDVKGVINAVNHNVGINKFLFEGAPGSGKTEAVKHVSKLLNRLLFVVDMENLIDSKLGQTNKNISQLFKEIKEVSSLHRVVILFDELDVIALDRVNNNDVREMGRATSMILKELDNLIMFNKEVVLIATTNLYSNFDKALIRRFDAIVNFNRYQKEDLIEISEHFFATFVKNFKSISRDTKLFRKILQVAEMLPYPGELKNIIRTSLAFSDINSDDEYLRRLYNSLVGDLDKKDLNQLYKEGFTMREIEKLKDEPKSTVARKLNRIEALDE